MSKIIEVKIPDLGGAEKVDVVEVLVEPGQEIDRDQGLVTLESEKASMDAPSPAAGTVREIALSRGDKVAEGDLVLTLELEDGSADKDSEPAQRGRPAEREGSVTEEPRQAPGKKRETPPAKARRRPSSPGGEIDLVVLGAGPGGYTAAFRAADLGMKVTLIERYPTLGGVCLNVGCIPSKALLHSAKVIDEAAAMAEHGVAFGKPAIDLVKLSRFKRSVVDRLTGGLGRLAKQRKVEVIQGTGTLTSAHALGVKLAEYMAGDPNYIPDSFYEELKAEFAEEEIVELVFGCSVFNFGNKFNITMRLEPDEESTYPKDMSYPLKAAKVAAE